MYPTKERPYFGVYVARQVAALQQLGVDVHVEEVAGPRGPMDYFAARSRIFKLVRRLRPDLIHAHYGYTALAVAGLSVPFLVTLCGDDLNGESNGTGGITLKSRIGILVTQTLTMRARHVLVMSEAMQARLLKGVRQRSEVLPYGIDEELFTPASIEAARARLGLPRTSIVITFVNSGAQPTKQLGLAQAVVADLRARGHQVVLLVAENVPATEMPWYYRAADCLLMTSEREGAPNAVRESLACGTPVVSVAVGDVPEIVRSPEQGRIARRDPVGLADAVEELVSSIPKRQRSLLDRRFHGSAVARRLAGIYQGLLANTPSRGR